jgi:hypothetical protein
VTAEREHRRVDHVDLDRVSRQLGLGPDELEAAIRTEVA